MAPPVPEVPGYSDLTVIGRGGFARVYRARQDRFRRDVALKVLDLADPDERTRERFERECQAMGELSWHPHVVVVHDSGTTTDGRLWLAMEFLAKGSLADGLSPASVLPWEAVVVVGIEVAGALGAAHAAGTLHRDLKPENVLLDPFGGAKLADFGIAAVDGARRTTTGVASFTVAHVAPEVLRGQRPDERTDVYGLASTLHTLLAGAPPFTADEDEAVAAVMMRVIETPPPRLGDPVPPALADLLVAALAKDPEDRPQSAAAFGEALQAVQVEAGLPVTPLRLAPPSGNEGTARQGGAVTMPSVPVDEDPGDQTVSVATPDGLTAEADPFETVTVATSPTPTPTPLTPPPASPTPPTPAGTPTEPASQAETSRRRPPTALVVAGAALVLVVAVGAVALLTRGGSSDDSNSGGGGGSTPAGTFQTDQVGSSLSGVALSSDAVWVTDADEQVVSRLDPTTGDVVATTDVDTAMIGVAATADDRVWVIPDSGTTVSVIDDGSNEVTDTIDINNRPDAISANGERVWVTATQDNGGSFVADINGRTRALDNLLGSSQSGPSQVSASDDVVWITNTGSNSITRLDPDTDVFTATIDLEVEPNAVAAVEDAVWVVSTDSRSLTRIDPATNEVVATIDLGSDTGPVAVAATSDAVWVVDNETDRVSRIDPATNTVTDVIEVSHEPVAIAATDTDVWVANSGDGTLTHIDPLAFG